MRKQQKEQEHGITMPVRSIVATHLDFLKSISSLADDLFRKRDRQKTGATGLVAYAATVSTPDVAQPLAMRYQSLGHSDSLNRTTILLLSATSRTDLYQHL
ncbi:hypothetical protein WJX79_002622 [Trebouxia sp. C0005]